MTTVDEMIRWAELKQSRRMINPEKLDSLYDELKKIHKEVFPEWRFGQLYANFTYWLRIEKQVDIFYVEEDKMLEYIKIFAGVK